VVIIIWLARSDYLNWRELKGALHPLYTPLVFLMIALMLLAQTERFRLLLRAQKVEISGWHNFKIFMIGAFFNYVVPGGVGGDAVKAYYLHKDLGHQSKSVPYTVIYDRFLGIIVMAAMAVAVVILDSHKFTTSHQLQSLAFFVILSFVGLMILAALGLAKKSRELILRCVPAKWGRIHSIFTSFFSAFEHYASAPGYVTGALIWSFLSQVASVLSIAFVGYALAANGLLQETVPLSAYFFICPIGFVLAAIPIAPGGIGVGQAAFFFMFNAYLGHKSFLGPATITWMQFGILVWSLSGLYFYVVRRE
jgi:glycosyltransferase 2 family protein